MRAGEEEGSRLNEERDESIPEGLEDGPDPDDLLGKADSPDAETFAEYHPTPSMDVGTIRLACASSWCSPRSNMTRSTRFGAWK